MVKQLTSTVSAPLLLFTTLTFYVCMSTQAMTIRGITLMVQLGLRFWNSLALHRPRTGVGASGVSWRWIALPMAMLLVIATTVLQGVAEGRIFSKAKLLFTANQQPQDVMEKRFGQQFFV
ncbi:hypothetical protein Q670_07375 [Alcanivorax sp. P2S70]|nr:hypothetical protein Q670_07375 [Alcanivorax sp. P2S70]